jgi:hypothetical protein
MNADDTNGFEPSLAVILGSAKDDGSEDSILLHPRNRRNPRSKPVSHSPKRKPPALAAPAAVVG